jgi:hypothetical protein
MEAKLLHLNIVLPNRVRMMDVPYAKNGSAALEIATRRSCALAQVDKQWVYWFGVRS